jgi:hypothetical protein
MLHGLLASFQVLGIDDYGRIYRKVFRRPSGFVFAEPAVAPCRYGPAPALPATQDNRRPRIIRSTVYNSMTISSTVRDRPVPALYGLMVVSLVALLPLPPLLQDQSHHQFADQRELFGRPNFWNVVSNLPFIAVGAVGLLRVGRDATTIVLFTGLFLTGFGSRHLVLGSAADDVVLRRNPCRSRRGTRGCESGSDVATAATGNRHFQSSAVALDR